MLKFQKAEKIELVFNEMLILLNCYSLVGEFFFMLKNYKEFIGFPIKFMIFGVKKSKSRRLSKKNFYFTTLYILNDCKSKILGSNKKIIILGWVDQE